MFYRLPSDCCWSDIYFTNTNIIVRYFSPFLLFLKSNELCSSLVCVGCMFVAPLGISCLVRCPSGLPRRPHKPCPKWHTLDLWTSSESSSEEVIIRQTGRVPLDSFSPGVILCRGEFDCSRLLL
ncbi:uncharacterized protein LOC122146046 [Cyprinus carpio]|uniref:Uncharacterized protein LOC122146046 n=1 Tax=Cyprinus carpio TaxID=7962 RepID=A0A9Q9YF17_CYPCA|nr:uncharacterized protein LOC122146046 [Cyprinus carpio]